jgi:hypothetical protein
VVNARKTKPRPDVRVPPVSEEREGAGYRFGIELGGLWAASGAGPKRFPGAFLFFYFSFVSFLFLFS